WRRRFHSTAGVLVVLSIFLLLTRDFLVLFPHQIQPGVDGYYYVLQIDTLYQTGLPYFSTPSLLILYLFVLIKYLVSDTILAIKIGTILLGATLGAGVGYLLYLLTRSARWASIGLLILYSSVLHLYYITELLSNLGGVTFLVWAACGLVKAVQTKRRGWI